MDDFHQHLKLDGGAVPDACRLDEVKTGDDEAKLCVLQQSFFEVKFTVELLVAASHQCGLTRPHSREKLQLDHRPSLTLTLWLRTESIR